MQTLHNIQRLFSQALYTNNASLIADRIQAGLVCAEIGLDVYRNNVFTNLREALRTLFPVIDRLVGNAFFDHLADAFIQDYPSPAGDLNQYGEDFSKFLTRFGPATCLVYLPDVARLEWAVHLVYHAQDSTGLDRQRLALVPSAEYGNLRFRLNPACKQVQSAYPVHKIWQYNQPDCSEDQRIELDQGGVSLLVSRRDFNIQLEMLTPGDSAFLSAIAENETFASACHYALQVDSAFSLQQAMAKYVLDEVLVDFDWDITCPAIIE